MTYRIVCPVENNQVTLTLPPGLKGRKEVTVVVEDPMETRAEKMDKLKQASSDPLFLADIQVIQHDFDFSDRETL